MADKPKDDQKLVDDVKDIPHEVGLGLVSGDGLTKEELEKLSK